MNCEDCIQFILSSSFYVDEDQDNGDFIICDINKQKIKYFDDKTYQEAVAELHSMCPLTLYAKVKKNK